MDNNKLLTKRSVKQGWKCTTFYSTGHTLRGIFPIRYTDTYTDTSIICFIKRDDSNKGYHSSVVETTAIDCPIGTMTFADEYMVPPGETCAASVTSTDSANYQAMPTTYATTV
ncbi:unnamed protein product [Ambrosiozyma monospora]|uniref:Unnamed protein product n=1 Tax=Ambrosiozyma monospora TaxID=43982 RepID=A0ACB5U708_AMBMO|nr:unnamed protein product [Ambrosiozyma monospora]